ncbi:MAG: amidohydrolase family protein [Solirubrobacteraceae bacterium]
MKTDLHQHLWTQPLVEALARRSEHPFVRDEHGLTVLFLAGERPYVIDLDSEEASRRAELARRDGLDRALVCLSSPLGIESLPRRDSTGLIDAYHEGALALGEPFSVWGALALDRLDPDDVDRALERGCVGISLPAGALGSIDGLASLSPVLSRIQEHDIPLFVHPGPGTRLPTHEATLGDPLWWPALTRYVAEVHAAWFVFVTAARRQFPELRVVFAMLAGLAPLHTERLLARGGPAIAIEDPLIFYDTSSNGPQAISLMERLVGGEQLLYGSDRPVVDPDCHGIREVLDWEHLASNADRLFARRSQRAEFSPDLEQSANPPLPQIEHSSRRRTQSRPPVGTQRSKPAAGPRPKRVAVLGRAVR